eukprot:1572632-Karenia_brevis.AAC.1
MAQQFKARWREGPQGKWIFHKFFTINSSARKSKMHNKASEMNCSTRSCGDAELPKSCCLRIAIATADACS